MEKTVNSIFERDTDNKIIRTKVNYYKSIFNFLYDIKKIETFPQKNDDLKKYINESENFILENLSVFASLVETDFKNKSILYKEDFKATKDYIFEFIYDKLPADWKGKKLYRAIFENKYDYRYIEIGYIIRYFIEYHKTTVEYDSLFSHIRYCRECDSDYDFEDRTINSWSKEAIKNMVDSGNLIIDKTNLYLSEKFYEKFYSFLINFRFFDSCIYKDRGINVEKIYNNYYDSIIIDRQDCKCDNISNGQLLDYLNCIVSINNNIISLKKRYSDLEGKRNGHLAWGHILEFYFDKYDELYVKKEKLIEEIRNLENKINKRFVYKTKKFLKYPSKISKPLFSMSIPKEPIMKKAGLFNKKKIEEENKRAINEYNIQKGKYEEKYNEYLHKLEKYENELEKYENEVQRIIIEEGKLNQEEYLKERRKYEKTIDFYKSNLDEKIKELEKFDKNFQFELNNLLFENDKYKQLKSIDYEMAYIRKCIKENIINEKKLYSYNILYGKYHNYIAVCSFIDYFNSGRCNTLDGPTGAYNLFEQESRSNLIVNKLDNILSSLEEIKDNQFYIYSELKDINHSLDIINGQLLVNNILQTVQIDELSKIIDNTNEIAYNTSVTAYYSKMAANSARALAMMNFLDRL